MDNVGERLGDAQKLIRELTGYVFRATAEIRDLAPTTEPAKVAEALLIEAAASARHAQDRLSWYVRHMGAIPRNTETTNEQADELMCEALNELGYGELVEAFKMLRVEYAASDRELETAHGGGYGDGYDEGFEDGRAKGYDEGHTDAYHELGERLGEA